MFQDWEELAGSVLDDAYEVGRVLRGGKAKAWFEGRDLLTQQPVSLQAFRAEDAAELRRIYLRFQEASFFEHPYLLRIHKVLWLEDSVCVVSERGEYDLPQFVEQKPLPVVDARELTAQLSEGLRFLHNENLVYCSLSADSVWKIGPDWKLADFSQLRVVSNADGETRKILSRLTGVPPEAYQGVISPAWDVWSLGVLLQRVLTPAPTHVEGAVSIPRGRQLRRHGLPEPFDEVTRRCLQPDPAERASLTEINAIVDNPQQAAQAAAPAAAEEPAQQQTYLIHDPPSHGRAWLAFVLGVLLVVAIATVWALKVRDQPVGESGRARTSASAPPVATFGTPDNRQPATSQQMNKPSPVEIPPVEHTNVGDLPIPALIERWAQATRDKNAAASAAFYAPKVKAFYGKRNLTREDVRRERERTYKQIGSVRRFDITNLQVTQLSKDSAVALFDKTYQFGTGKVGSVRQQLSFGRYGGGWRITTERDLHVYR